MKINTSSYGLKITFSVLVFFGGLLFLNYLSVVSIFIWLTIILIIGTHNGIEFNLIENKYRYYKSVLGFTKGEWKDLSKYVGIVILSGKGSKQTFGPNLAMTRTYRGLINRVCLVNENHREKIHLYTKSDLSDAKKYANRISEKFKLPVVKFNPKISEKTLKRKEERKKVANKT
jgi:hypothetical protein